MSLSVIAGRGTLTVSAGLSFCVSSDQGDIEPGPAGLIVRDTRHLSRLSLLVDRVVPTVLGSSVTSPDAVTFRSFQARDGHLDPPLEVERRRVVAPGALRERIALSWWPGAAARATVALEVDADFADIFEVRRLAIGAQADRPVRRVDSAWKVSLEEVDGDRRTTIRLSRAAERRDRGVLVWNAHLERGRPWVLELLVTTGGGGIGSVARLGSCGADGPAAVVTEPPGLATACAASFADLDQLSVRDPQDPTGQILTAGIPWYVALFGRDSLIASYQGRAFSPTRLRQTLRSLAARQGRIEDRANEEQPGKILHEVRLSDRPWLGSGTTRGARPYFGSVDATPLFAICLGAAWRRGLDRHTLDELLPAALAAADWMRSWGDPDGDGFVEYSGAARGLANQGWKDSENAVQHPDGTLASGPIALVEVQGYVYRARRELAALLAGLGRDDEASVLTAEADQLRRAIRERFWCPGAEGSPGFFALALDGDKRAVEALASNMGHLLWCGVPTNAQAEQVAAHLTGPGLASGWGVRTLSAEMDGFNPISYHAGSVWPHDTAIAVEGLRRYGLEAPALTLGRFLLDALAAFDGRLPELFGGHPRSTAGGPVPYPTACRPQAWAAGVPLSLLTTFLGLDIDVPRRTIQLAPSLPPEVGRIGVRGLPIAGGHLSMDAAGTEARIVEAPPGITVELRTGVPTPEMGASGLAPGTRANPREQGDLP